MGFSDQHSNISSQVSYKNSIPLAPHYTQRAAEVSKTAARGESGENRTCKWPIVLCARRQGKVEGIFCVTGLDNTYCIRTVSKPGNPNKPSFSHSPVTLTQALSSNKTHSVKCQSQRPQQRILSPSAMLIQKSFFFPPPSFHIPKPLENLPLLPKTNYTNSLGNSVSWLSPSL